MSTLKLENIKHENSSTNNMVMDSDGSVSTTGNASVGGTLGVTGATTMGGTLGVTGQLIAANSLQVGDASINQQYTNLGYIADFQASSGGQTYISIAEPGASSLGDTGVVIGEDTANTYITQRGNKPIIIATQNLNRIVADGSGRVTLPYQPSFQAYRTNYTQNASAVSTIICPNVAHNTGNHYNSSNGTFTAPVAGKYLFMFWGLSYPHTTGVNYVAFYKNGGTYADLVQFGGNAQNHQPISGSMIIDCAVNDAITHIYWTAGSAKAYGGQWNFSGHLLS